MVHSTLEESGQWQREPDQFRETPSGKRRINLLISDTGGGHRACALALRESLLERAPDLEVHLVDGLRESGLYPISRMPEFYTRWSERRHLWRTTFHLSNGRRWSHALFYPWQKLSSAQLRAAILRDDPDLIVNLHPCLTAAAIHFAKRAPRQPRVATMVTDLFYGHASWFQHGAHDYYVPTRTMADLALRMGIPESSIHLSGFPLAPRLRRLNQNREALRRHLGFSSPTIVCVGGADGMGIQRIVPALLRLPSNLSIHLVCGKNADLKNHFLQRQLPANFTIHGFTRQLPEMLAAADLALIKASPTVLMEALSAGTYVLLYDYVPGQESANVRFVKDHGLGDYSRSPRSIAAKIRRLLSSGERPLPSQLSTAVDLDGAAFIAERILQQIRPPAPEPEVSELDFSSS